MCVQTFLKKYFKSAFKFPNSVYYECFKTEIIFLKFFIFSGINLLPCLDSNGRYQVLYVIYI